MRWMIESLKKRIEDSKLNIAEAYIEFFGEEYRERIIDRVANTEVLIYKNDINQAIINRFQYLLTFDQSNDPEIQSYMQELRSARMYARILENFDKTLTNVCKHYFAISCTDFNPESFLNSLRAFDRKSKLSIKDRARLKSLFFQYLGISPEKELNEVINKKNLQDFESAIKKVMKLKSKISIYLENNFEELNGQLSSKGYKYFNLIQPKNTESYCTYAKTNHKVVPVCLFNFHSMAFGRETLYTHEFGHAIDMSNDLKKSGLHVKENYKLLNEALTDAIAKEVSDILYKKNKIILVDKRSLVLYSKYAILNPLGAALVKHFRQDLAKMKFGNEEEMYTVIDKTTMLSLEDLCFKAMYDETISREEKKKLIQDGIKIIENYKNTKNRY